MTRFTRDTCRAAGAGLLALAAASAGASSAQAAQTSTVNYKCKFPLIGTQPLKLDITLDIPDSWEPGVPTAPFGITAKASAGGTTAQGLGLVEGLALIGGVTEASKPGKGTASRARVELPDGTGVNVRVPIEVTPYTVVPPIPDPLVLNAAGTTPSLTLDAEGTAKIVLTELILNLYGHYSDGTPVEGLVTPATDIDRQPYADIDGDIGTFNVPCKLDPAGQNLQLATFELISPTPTPILDPCEIFYSCSRPQTPADVSVGPVSAEGGAIVSWTAIPFPGHAEGFADDVEYIVEIDGQVVGTTEDTRLVIHVDPAAAHTGSVTARYARSGIKTSEPAPFTIPAAPANQPPTKPGVPTATSIGVDQIALSWGRSTDDAPGLAYEVFRGATKIATVSNITRYVATGLSPDTTYDFRVEAVDAGGLRTVGDTATLRTIAAVPGRQKASLGYRCKFPIVGTVPVKLEIGTDLPETSPVGQPVSGAVNVRATFALPTGGIGIPFEGLGTLSGVTGARSSALALGIVPPSGAVIDKRVAVDYAPTTVSHPVGDAFVLNGAGVLDGLTVNELGTTKVNLVRPEFNLRALDFDGAPVEGMTTPPTDIDRQPYADIDGDPGTFNVPCKLEPATQDLLLATFETTPTVPPTTPTTASYTAAGSVKLATLLRGSAGLKGQADLTFGPPANARTVNGTLDLGQTSGRLVALGFLPVTAKLGFVSSGAATGFVGGFTGGLNLNQKVRIKVLEAKLFGAIPLIAGNSCQTKQLTTLSLASPGGFSTANGGALAGTFSMSDLNGCGALNGLVSPLTAGGGNTITVNLTKRP